MTTEMNRSDERPSSFVSLLSGWVQQGVESFFATQRILVDLAMRQNTNAMKTIREELSFSEKSKDRPQNILVEMAVEGTANYIEAQRILLDLAQKQNHIVLNGVKERVEDYGTAVTVANVVREGIDTFIEMQHNFLTLASKRTQGWLKSSEGKGKANFNLITLAGEAMEEFVASQKKFLDVISDEMGKSDGKKEHAAKKAEKTELVDLARDAANSFIDAQKKLLDLAGQQVNVNMQAASRVMDYRMPLRFMPVADVAGEGVKSFVDAEKALVDSFMKARTRPKETAAKATPHHAKKTVRSRAKVRRTHAKAAKA
ncbi:MAG: hypothetical protein CXZ00_08275 [Acidobacteria bacterium]|nr:MAG: hypothetical protein CXZ00_08275 [Acidobacteriota bacterium]